MKAGRVAFYKAIFNSWGVNDTYVIYLTFEKLNKNTIVPKVTILFKDLDINIIKSFNQILNEPTNKVQENDIVEVVSLTEDCWNFQEYANTSR